ncbi:MAG: hypothetical protein LBS99_00780 [Clostridiales bacterium]|jgi:hypothetical protein|nr:hypothetical protein [Clostridiales bacterium]
MQKIIDETADRYRKILDKYYPAHKSTGFTERNLTVNFCTALAQIYGDDVVVWYEAPVGDGNSRLDAFVIDFKNKRLFLIEAKRFDKIDKKVPSVFSDIEKIINGSNLEFLLRENPHIDVKKFKAYGVILGDVWTKKDNIKLDDEFIKKQELRNSFENDTFLQSHKYQNIDKLGAVKCYCSKKINSTLDEDYTLLAMTIEIA